MILGRSWGGPGRSWGGLGVVFEPSWAVLGHVGVVLEPSWAIMGDLGAVLEPSWSIPGRSWGGLGAVLGGLGRSWGRLGRSWAILARSWNRLGPSWAVLGWSWSGLGPSWAILGGFGTNLDRFGVDLVYLFWRSRSDAKKCATRVPNVFSKTQFLETRPSEGLRSSLPLSALPVLARKGLSWRPFSHQWSSWAVLGRSWSGPGPS